MREQKIVRVEAPSGEGGKGSGFRGLMNTLMQLRKICNHPYIFNEAVRTHTRCTRRGLHLT
jgi:hypothetical protein